MISKDEIRRKYNELGGTKYDLFEGIFLDWLGIRRKRKRLINRASGKVLEVGVGTGRNLNLYPPGCKITGIDLSEGMLSAARKKAGKLNHSPTFCIGDAENLPFSDGVFDTVVDTLNLCTYPDPLRALQEFKRVCKKDGTILLFEHGRSAKNFLAGWQDRRANKHMEALGCQWNRDHLALAEAAGLKIFTAKRTFFGIFYELIARN